MGILSGIAEAFDTGGRGFLKARLKETRLEPGGFLKEASGPEIIAIELMGIPDWQYTESATLIHTATDVTDPNDPRGILSIHPEFCQDSDPANAVMWHLRYDMGPIAQGMGLATWARHGALLLDAVVPPESGTRIIQINSFIYETISVPRTWRQGRPAGQSEAALRESMASKQRPGLIMAQFNRITIPFKRGYEELNEDEIPARKATIYLAMSVAMADGNLHNREGAIIKEWMTKTIDRYPASARSEAKQQFNKALRESHTAAKGRTTAPPYKKWANALNQLSSSDHQKYDAIQLCFDVLAADDDAKKEELKQVKEIAAQLNLDYEEIEKIKSQALVNVQIITEDDKGVDDLIGIEPSWTKQKKMEHLTESFDRWNNRLINLPPGQKREQAKKMVNRIAEAQKKYAK
jgi:uncharacterized tellurite resistance protein B-like protein